MQSEAHAAPISVGAPWIGRGVSVLAILFVLVDGIMKLFTPAPVVESMTTLGYPDRLTVGIGILAIVCIAVYAWPRTSILGAILMTGYLGGAVASQVRIDAGLFPIFFPIFIGALIWGGLYLRDDRVREFVSSRG